MGLCSEHNMEKSRAETEEAWMKGGGSLDEGASDDAEMRKVHRRQGHQGVVIHWMPGKAEEEPQFPRGWARGRLFGLVGVELGVS